jgi:hypothetical protein
VVNPTFVADVAGTYTVQLIVNDGTVDSAPDSVVISASSAVAVDLDIKDINVTQEVKLKEPKPFRIRMDVKNYGMVDEPRPATVIGVQNGMEVYNETIMVSDAPGDDDHTRFESFPTFTPTPDHVGKIMWTATIEDDDPDPDVATAQTKVIDDREGHEDHED